MNLLFICLILIAVIITIVSLYYKFLRVIVCKNHSGTYELTGQFISGRSSALLPNPLGMHQYTIKVHKGRLRLNHNAYNPDGGTWTLPPVREKKPFYDLHDSGTYTFIIQIGEHFGEKDVLSLVNISFRKKAEFSYSVKPVWNHGVGNS